MQTRQLGQSGIEASIIGLGTWGMGGWMWGGTDEAAAIKAIHAAIDAGVNLIDTAPAYGLGLSEEIVGKAIRGRRNQVVLATKCGLVWHTNGGNYFFTEDDHPVHRYLGRDSIRHEVEESLRRLQTDTIDLYQTHWQDPTTPIEETMNTLLDLKREGKIRAIGVSNVSIPELSNYLRIGPVDSVQEKYSMLDRELEAELLPYCQQHGVAMLSYSSLALGLLSGKIGPDRAFTGDDQRASDPRFSVENRQRVADMLREIEPIAERYGLSVAQLAIAWTAQQPGITHVLCGARNPAQALENARAGDVHLTEADFAAVDQAVRSYQPIV
jgi:methylglyoxal reductase